VEDKRSAALGDGPLDVGEGLELALRHGDAADVAATEDLGSAVVIA